MRLTARRSFRKLHAYLSTGSHPVWPHNPLFKDEHKETLEGHAPFWGLDKPISHVFLSKCECVDPIYQKTSVVTTWYTIQIRRLSVHEKNTNPLGREGSLGVGSNLIEWPCCGKADATVYASSRHTNNWIPLVSYLQHMKKMFTSFHILLSSLFRHHFCSCNYA